MRIAGSVLMILSVIAIGIAFIMDTSVSTYGVSSGLGLSGLNLPSQVSNLGLLQKQMMVLQTGLAGFVAGAVLYGMGEIAEIFRPMAHASAPDVPADNASQSPTSGPINSDDTPNDTPVVVGLLIAAFVLLAVILAITTNVRRGNVAGGNAINEATDLNVGLDAMDLGESGLVDNNVEAVVDAR
jgi:hypothetical protein